MILIASDGVWEFLTNQTVVNMMVQFKSPLKACRAVVNEAYKLWLQYDVRTDDITMIAIYLEDMEKVDEAHQQHFDKDQSKRRSSVSQVKAKIDAETANMRKKSLANRKMSMGAGLGGLHVEDDLETEVESRPVRRVMTKEKRKLMSDNADDGKQVAEAGFNYKVVGKVKSADLVEINRAVKTNFLLSHLNETQRDEVFSSMEVCEAKVGNDVIVEGQPGDWFYVVSSGEYNVLVDGNVVHTYEYDETDETKASFGELALMYNTNRRAATVRCTQAGTVWRLNKRAFSQTVQRADAGKLMKTLRSVEALKALNKTQLVQLQDSLSVVQFKPGENVIRQGEEGKEFYVIEEGDAVVTVNEPLAPGGQKEVMQLHPGDYFGERALLNEVADSRRAATVKAITTMKLLQISKDEFEASLGRLDVIIDNHRKEREEAARKAYVQRQAEKLLDVTQSDFSPVLKVCKLFSDASTLYLVKRLDPDNKEQRFTLRVYEKKAIADQNLKKLVMNEVTLMGELPQVPYMPALLATFSDRSKLFSVYGSMITSELSEVLGDRILYKEGADGERLVQFIMGCVIGAVYHLHMNDVICRMIFKDTLVLDWKGYPLVADLTLSKSLKDSDKTYTLCGAPEYNAPEQIKKTGYGYESDYWALGVLIYELFTGTTPWPAMVAEKKKKSVADAGEPSAVEVYQAITDYKPTMGNEKEMNYPQSLGKPSIDVMDDLIDPAIDTRLGCRGSLDENIAEIESHQFFDDFNWSQLEDGGTPSPFNNEKEKGHKAFASAAIKFDTVPEYKGDNKWCDDWDFTGTVGYQVVGGK